MSFKILDKYISLCKELKKEPTFKGLEYFRKAFD